MPWLKALHIIFMVTWFAGLFYLPRLFVYHAMLGDEKTAGDDTTAGADERGNRRFKTMERKLYFGIMTPGAALTLISGLWLWSGYGGGGALWLYAKLALVAVLLAFHVLCGKYLFDFRNDRNRHGHRFYRLLNEVPTVLLVAIVLLAVLRPF